MRPEDVLTRRQVAAQYPISVSHLARYTMEPDKRPNGLPPGPPVIRLGRKVLYRRGDFDAWLASLAHQPALPAAPVTRGRPTKAVQIARRQRADG